MPGSSSAASSRGVASPSTAIALGATVSQPPADAGMLPDAPPSSGGLDQAGYVDALRPACASCTPIAAPWPRTKSVIRRQAATCSSFHSPVSCGEIRASGLTAVASAITSPAPPTAKAP